MLIQRLGTPVSDPFFAAVRRRHPDVDLVMLPTADVPDPAEPLPGFGVLVGQVSDENVADVRRRLVREVTRLWSIAVPGDPGEPLISLRYGDDDSHVRVVAVASSERGDGAEALARLRRDLESTGRDVRIRAGAVELLSADLGNLDVITTHAVSTGAVMLTVRSKALFVGGDRARALVRASGR